MRGLRFILNIVYLYLFFAINSALLLADESTVIRRMAAQRTTANIKIDGVIEAGEWIEASKASNFTTFEPNVGQKPSQRTEVLVTYDDEAIYIAAQLYDEAPDSILKQVGIRDSWNLNADYFGVFLDTYNDKQNGFGFIVTASEVQNDARYSAFGEDRSWDAVWFRGISINEKGWSVEMKIPYAALRFPEKNIQDWGIGFMRQIRRHRERAMWNDYDPAQDGFVNQFGLLEGLENIQPPLRLQMTPYVSFYTDAYRNPSNASDNTTTNFIRGGMDVKYGINESFTLDMILIPDFGQVQTDDEVFNISPFEIEYQENRPFFTEGVELFNKGNLFYSRRVGGTPNGFFDVENELAADERIIDNPGEVQLYNATKVSGRTENNLGIGVFNAVTGNTYATIENEAGEKRQILTEPLTNYNLTVFDQALKNRSYVSLINANVTRMGAARDANVTAVDYRLSDKNNKYAVGGVFALSQIYDREQSNNPTLGFRQNIELAKVSGNWQYGILSNIESHTFDPNDLGLLFANNEVTNGAFVSYQTFNPKGIINNRSHNLNVFYERLYKPGNFTNLSVNANTYITFTNFLTIGTFLEWQPVEGNNYFEPRVDGRFSKTSEYVGLSGFFSSDYRKKFALDGDIGGAAGGLYNERFFWWGISPRLRPSDRLLIIHRFNQDINARNVGYAAIADNDDVIFAYRDVSSISNTLELSYTFTSRMSLSSRLRHYWFRVVYDQYFLLQNDGYIGQTNFNENLNTSFNAFTYNLTYSWEFTPGSELSVVWKYDIFRNDDAESNVYQDIPKLSYWRNVQNTFDAPQTNSISIRLLYFLDAQSFKALRRKR